MFSQRTKSQLAENLFTKPRQRSILSHEGLRSLSFQTANLLLNNVTQKFAERQFHGVLLEKEIKPFFDLNVF